MRLRGFVLLAGLVACGSDATPAAPPDAAATPGIDADAYGCERRATADESTCPGFLSSYPPVTPEIATEINRDIPASHMLVLAVSLGCSERDETSSIVIVGSYEAGVAPGSFLLSDMAGLPPWRVSLSEQEAGGSPRGLVAVGGLLVIDSVEGRLIGRVRGLELADDAELPTCGAVVDDFDFDVPILR